MQSKMADISSYIRPNQFWVVTGMQSVIRCKGLLRSQNLGIYTNPQPLLTNRLQCVVIVGIGSGCILLSILKEKKNFRGIGIDLSDKTLKICRTNSHKLGVGNRLKLYKSNIELAIAILPVV